MRELLIVLIGAGSLFIPATGGVVQAEQPPAGTSILPRPVVEKITGEQITLAKKGGAVGINVLSWSSGPMAEGIKLLTRRLALMDHTLGYGDAPSISLFRVDEKTLVQAMEGLGLSPDLGRDRRRQAYHLQVDSMKRADVHVRIEAVDDWGLYYGIVSLCQLMEAGDGGALTVPVVEIVDYPEIAHRLAKCSASDPPSFVNRYAAWMPLYKISQLGLQYHGNNSKNPGDNFTTNIKTLCPKLRNEGTLESIVYFCPFRGEGPRGQDHLKGSYDFSNEADRKAYADYLLWILSQGADGIEVDYNDWPGSKEVPIADVLNLACDTIKAKYPNSYVLYCPPSTGPQAYSIMASPQMHETLSKVPPRVWPLWVGLRTRSMEHPSTAKPLTAAEAEQWAKNAGRRPFLWINRVAADVQWSVSRPVAGTDGRAFAGDLFPRELNRLFEGVHLNTGRFSKALLEGKPREPGDEAERQFDKGELIYLATVADFLWNPAKWEPKESYRRAVHFVDVMSKLAPEGATASASK